MVGVRGKCGAAGAGIGWRGLTNPADGRRVESRTCGEFLSVEGGYCRDIFGDSLARGGGYLVGARSFSLWLWFVGD